MIFVRLLRFLMGYVKLTVSGKYPERFLNLCANRGIRVWNSRRRGESIECCLFARDYKTLRAFRRDCGVTLRIRRKCGLPFFCHRYRRRAGFLCGAALFCAFLAVMPRFVWSIEVKSDGGVDEAAVKATLADMGLTVGTPLRQIDAGDMRLQLALRMPEVSWAAINDDGTAVTVEVRAVEPKQEAPTGYANLIARREGQVTALTVRSGSAVVRVGDAVVAGQLLVSGTEQYTDGRTVFRYSDGEVMAETRRVVTVSVPYRQTVTADVGEPIVRRAASAFGLTIPLYVGDVKGSYRREVERRDLVIGGVTLPVSLTTATFTPVRDKTVTLTEQQAKDRAAALLKTEMALQLEGAEVLESEVTYTPGEDGVTAEAVCVCRENIAYAEPLAVETESADKT